MERGELLMKEIDGEKERGSKKRSAPFHNILGFVFKEGDLRRIGSER